MANKYPYMKEKCLESKKAYTRKKSKISEKGKIYHTKNVPYMTCGKPILNQKRGRYEKVAVCTRLEFQVSFTYSSLSVG